MTYFLQYLPSFKTSATFHSLSENSFYYSDSSSPLSDLRKTNGTLKKNMEHSTKEMEQRERSHSQIHLLTRIAIMNKIPANLLQDLKLS